MIGFFIFLCYLVIYFIYLFLADAISHTSKLIQRQKYFIFSQYFALVNLTDSNKNKSTSLLHHFI